MEYKDRYVVRADGQEESGETDPRKKDSHGAKGQTSLQIYDINPRL
jgi:hypothetical protein